jgi:hypothetical protein
MPPPYSELTRRARHGQAVKEFGIAANFSMGLPPPSDHVVTFLRHRLQVLQIEEQRLAAVMRLSVMHDGRKPYVSMCHATLAPAHGMLAQQLPTQPLPSCRPVERQVTTVALEAPRLISDRSVLLTPPAVVHGLWAPCNAARCREG